MRAGQSDEMITYRASPVREVECAGPIIHQRHRVYLGKEVTCALKSLRHLVCAAEVLLGRLWNHVVELWWLVVTKRLYFRSCV